MSLLNELVNEMGLGPSAISSISLAADVGETNAAMQQAEKKALKKKKQLRKKLTFTDHLREDAAGGATAGGAIANFAGSLFGGGVVDVKAARKRQEKLMRGMGYKFTRLEEDGHLAKQTDFNPNDVISKLDAANKKASNEKDTVAFGMEDEEGNIIKVHVRDEQADEFELALSRLLAGEDENDDEENTPLEIAEVLFQLKDKFDIINVEWGEIPQDEEEEQELEGDENTDLEGAEGDLEGGDLEGGEDLEMTAGDETEDVDDAKSVLQQVIDMMKMDAEAKTADAEARKAEAKAEEAKYTSRSAAAKVQQEEEILDMEAYNDGKVSEEKEAKQLSKLAKYKHDMAGENDTSITKLSVENEEQADEDDDDINVDGEISQDELAELIFRQLQGEK